MFIKVEKVDLNDVFVVPKKFVDDFLSGTNGEYIKVYLYILKNNIRDINLSDIADNLNMLENDVLRALRFYESKQLLNICEDDIKEAQKENIEENKEDIQNIKDKNSDEDISDIKNNIDMRKFNDDEKFKTLMYVYQKYLNKTLSQTAARTLAYIYDILKMPYELLEYIIEEAANNNIKSMRYIETVAIAWHSEGIDSVQKAKQFKKIYNKRVGLIKKAMGIKNSRDLIDDEIIYIKKWFNTYAFSDEIVVKACSKTIANTNKPSFQYADTILTTWYKNNVKSLEDIELINEKQNIKNKSKNKNIYRNNDKFNMFIPRDKEIDEQSIYDRIL